MHAYDKSQKRPQMNEYICLLESLCPSGAEVRKDSPCTAILSCSLCGRTVDAVVLSSTSSVLNQRPALGICTLCVIFSIPNKDNFFNKLKYGGYALYY